MTNTDQEGFSRVKEALEKLGYRVDSLSLLQSGKIPEDTSVFVIAGPRKSLLAQEIRALEHFMNQNGKILALINPQTETNLAPFLSQWGIRLGPGIVVDTLSRLFGGDLTIPIVTRYSFHEITEDFGLATFYPVAQPVQFESSDSQLNFHSLAETTENSWSKKDLLKGDDSFNPETDLQGPLILAGIVTRKSSDASLQNTQDLDPGSLKITDATTDEATLVVFGDSDFAANGYFDFSGNGDFFLNTINFLAKEKDLIAITPKKPNFAPLFLTRTQGNVVMYTTVILIPSATFFTGWVIWRRRRRL